MCLGKYLLYLQHIFRRLIKLETIQNNDQQLKIAQSKIDIISPCFSLSFVEMNSIYYVKLMKTAVDILNIYFFLKQ